VTTVTSYPSSTSNATRQSEPLSGPRVRRFQALAKECGLWLSCGGFHETAPAPRAPATDAAADAAAAAAAAHGEGTKVFNSHLIISPSGELAAVYRKVCAHARLAAQWAEEGRDHPSPLFLLKLQCFFRSCT